MHCVQVKENNFYVCSSKPPPPPPHFAEKIPGQDYEDTIQKINWSNMNDDCIRHCMIIMGPLRLDVRLLHRALSHRMNFTYTLIQLWGPLRLHYTQTIMPHPTPNGDQHFVTGQ